LSEDGKTCVGVLAADGTRWPADRVVLATGAWSPTLVDLEGQCVSKVRAASSQDAKRSR
jgi:sarcosine oxidase/L-pipecolate oxidase